MRLSGAVIIVLLLLLLMGCGSSPIATEKSGVYTVTDISKGLPATGLWRENVVLFDMDGDGQLDIVTPPPRKAPEGQRRLFIFSRDSEAGWKEKIYDVPGGKEYGYGGIAVGDLNGDRYPDVVFGEHSRNIILFMGNGKGGFTVSPLSVEGKFYSRAIELSDINNDGRTDIIALSESSYVEGYEPRGVLTAVNKGGNDWDVKVLGEDSGIAGDSLAVGDISGEGNRDIAAAHSTAESVKKLIWFGDGKGAFEGYNGDIVSNTVPYVVGLGDIDGDGRDEVFFRLAGIGKEAKVSLGAYKWNGDAFINISSGLEKEEPIALDLADIDGDGKKEMVLLSENGIRIYKYIESSWVGQGAYDLPPADTKGCRSLKVGKDKDGTQLIVYNMGFEAAGLHRGIKAFILNKR